MAYCALRRESRDPEADPETAYLNERFEKVVLLLSPTSYTQIRIP